MKSSVDLKIALREFLVKAGLIKLAGNVYRYTYFLWGDHFLKMRESGQAPVPKTLIYEPTARCNLKCKMCYLNTADIARKGELDTASALKMIRSLPAGIKHVSVTGGEPTVRDDLQDILEAFKEKGATVTLMTNGMAPEKLKGLLDNKLLMAVQLSLDGHAELHNSIRNSPRAHERFLDSLRLLRGYRGVYAYILTVICKDNLESLAEISEFCAKENIVNLTFEFEKRYDRGCIEESIKLMRPEMELARDEFFITESKDAFMEYGLDELLSALRRAEKTASNNRFHNQYLPYSLLKNAGLFYGRQVRKKFRMQCKHLLTLRVDPRGNVIPCFGIRRPFGNLMERGLDEIWNSAEFRAYRKAILKKNLLPICETCHRAESYDLGFGRIN